jgi:UDP-sulfoquinovose synthase
MRVFIAGIDGYLGWSLALYLANRGHDIGGADCYLRRDWVAEMGSHSAIPIARMTARGEAFRRRFGKALQFHRVDLTNYNALWNALRAFRPDAVVHFGEMPSAPYSMIDAQHAVWTHTNNLTGTLNMLYVMRDEFPNCHLLKLGTMGEYGTPNVAIPEGDFEIEYKGRKDTLPFPRQAGSWYHQTKVHDSNNIRMACKFWGLRSTDIMQGVVYGTRIDEMFDDGRHSTCAEMDMVGAFKDLRTRFDFDGAFGTAINRFCAQAVAGVPITPYGKGKQRRGFLPLRDSMQCLTLALENPPKRGEYRVFNQFEQVYSVMELAQHVQKAARHKGIDVSVRKLANPRVEDEEHFYKPVHKKLLALGYKPTTDMWGELIGMLDDLWMYKDRIVSNDHVLIPDVRWSGERKPVDYLK